MTEQISNNNVVVDSVFNLLGKSWEIVKNNWQMFAFVNILSILYAVLAMFEYKGRDGGNEWINKTSDVSGAQIATIVGGGLLVLLAVLAIYFFFYTMAVSLEVKTAGGKKPDFNELINDGKKYFFPLLGLMIIIGFIVVIGFVLLIIPGIIAIGRLIMAPYIMIDKKVGINEALKQSNELGKKHFWQIWAAVLLVIAVSLASGILEATPLIGPLLAVAVAIAFSLIVALRYHQLQGRKV